MTESQNHIDKGLNIPHTAKTHEMEENYNYDNMFKYNTVLSQRLTVCSSFCFALHNNIK